MSKVVGLDWSRYLVRLANLIKCNEWESEDFKQIASTYQATRVSDLKSTPLSVVS